MQPSPYRSVKRNKPPSGVNEVPLSQDEFFKQARDNYRAAHKAYALEKEKVVQQRRPFALDDESSNAMVIKPVSDEVRLSRDEFAKQAQENYRSAYMAYKGQKDKTVTSTGSKQCFSPPDGPSIGQFAEEVKASETMSHEQFMAQAKVNRAEAFGMYRDQMGKVRSASSMASPDKEIVAPQRTSPLEVGEGATQAHHALWRQKRDKRFMETEYVQSQNEYSKLAAANFRSANIAYKTQKDKTVKGNFDPLAPQEGVTVAEVGPKKLNAEDFMAQAAANRKLARDAYELQKGKVRQSSM